jgi:excisionase family DNA binding protein
MTSQYYLTPTEAAQYLRSSRSTLAKLRVYGGGPTFCRLGRAIRYRQSDLDEFMNRSAARSTSEANRCRRTGGQLSRGQSQD